MERATCHRPHRTRSQYGTSRAELRTRRLRHHQGSACQAVFPQPARVRCSPGAAEAKARLAPEVRALILTLLFLTGARGEGSETPPGFEPVESAFLGFMTANALPGASLAIAKNGKLVLARGYGLADVELNQPVQPEATLRFGSIGKTITATAIMKLVQDGKLDLDANAFALIPDIRPRSGRLGDSRINRITIRNLLTHSGGWDASRSGDPIVAPFSQQIASAMGVAFPPPPSTVISYMLDRPLDFDPGTRFAYSNLGFLVLARVIEKVSGLPYSEFVRLQVLAPLGIERMRQGRTPLSLRAPGEVRYYDYPGAPLVESVSALAPQDPMRSGRTAAANSGRPRLRAGRATAGPGP
ncbi:MAG: hypothetical protein C5B51_04595 [Terriglobia bacterium]|nr:MAG: hypothetical protein C5B51_04595 [Terriglobia bacterium]